MWYLLALFMWIIITPYFIKLKHCVSISFLLGIIVGYQQDIGTYLTLSRFFVFYPFFLIGYYIDESHFEKIFNTKIRLLSIFILTTIFIIICKLPSNFDVTWLYGRDSYLTLKSIRWYFGFYRILIYI